MRGDRRTEKKEERWRREGRECAANLQQIRRCETRRWRVAVAKEDVQQQIGFHKQIFTNYYMFTNEQKCFFFTI